MKKFILATLVLAPAVAFAQTAGTPTLNNLQELARAIGRLVDLTLPVVVAIALLAFFWGLVRFIFAGADESKAAGKHLMIWGLVAIFVMVSVWGLVRFIGNALGISGEGGQVNIPSVQFR